MNKITLIGRLTKDPETKNLSEDKQVTNFTLAVNRKVAGEGQPQADFINCQAWNKTSQFISKYFTKGQQVAVVGRIQTRTWDDNEGKKRHTVEVVVEEVFFTDSKKENSNSNSSNYSTSNNNTCNVFDEDNELPF